jgi:hypothetical protein
MTKTLALAIFLCGLGCAGGAATQFQTHRKMLDKPTEIQGYPCAKDYAWFFSSGRLNRCTVSREIVFGEALIPARSIIELGEDGTPNYAMMNHDATILGVHCSGGNRLLGPAEGAMTSFYPTGKFWACFPTDDQVVQGVPCAKGGFWVATFGHEWPTEFYESGKLKSCKLSTDYGSQKRGDRFIQVP